jgi:hypothetical protein
VFLVVVLGSIVSHHHTQKPNFQSEAVLACGLCVLSECFVFLDQH